MVSDACSRYMFAKSSIQVNEKTNSSLPKSEGAGNYIPTSFEGLLLRYQLFSVMGSGRPLGNTPLTIPHTPCRRRATHPAESDDPPMVYILRGASRGGDGRTPNASRLLRSSSPSCRSRR